MLTWWTDTVTVYHRIEEKNEGKTTIRWEREVCSSCFYGSVTNRVRNGNSVSYINSQIVRLPHNTKGIKVGDIAVIGTVDDVIPDGDSGAKLVDKYKKHAFFVKVAKDNSRSGLPFPHYYGGE